MATIDPDMLDLIQKIKRFDHEAAKPADSAALAQALQLVAEDVVAQHSEVARLRAELERKVAIADTCTELAAVVQRLRPAPSKPFWRRYLP
jgi:uncharacterized small protein (DUF1192 family)